MLNVFIYFQLFETSAHQDTDCDNIEGIFLTLAHKLKNHKPLMPPVSPRSISSQSNVITLGKDNHYSSATVDETSDSCYC